MDRLGVTQGFDDRRARVRVGVRVRVRVKVRLRLSRLNRAHPNPNPNPNINPNPIHNPNLQHALGWGTSPLSAACALASLVVRIHKREGTLTLTLS